jgi:hypothetical protein
MTLKYVEELKTKAEALSLRVIDAWEREHGGGAPDVLWHYTGRPGFEGMSSSSEMWLTNALFLNDKSELNYGIALIQRTLQEMKVRCHSPLIEKFLQDSSVSMQVTNLIVGAYVASFSEPDDLLSQWDRYADYSKGYSIGFRAADLIKGRPHLQLRKVFYEESEQVPIIENIAEQFCNMLAREINVSAAPQYNNSVLHNSSMAMFHVFIQHLYCFKHRGFREEQEWRLVETLKPVSGASRLHYRTSGTLTNAPYVVENLGVPGPSGNKLPIAEIYCGPRCPPGSGEKYLINWLSAHGYSPLPTITASTIPLR